MGWARPSPAQPGHWPKPVTRLGQSTRAWHCSKAIKLPSHSVLANLKNAKMKKRAYLLLETEDACSADGSSPMVSLYLPSVLTLSAFPLRFSQRLLKPRRWWRGRPAVNWLLILGFLQEQKQWQKPIPLAVLLLDVSLLSVFFLCFVLCFVWFPSVPLFFFRVPLSPSVLWFLPPSVVFLSCLCLCLVFSVQDEEIGGKSTRICCWLRDQNFPRFSLFVPHSFALSSSLAL